MGAVSVFAIFAPLFSLSPDGDGPQLFIFHVAEVFPVLVNVFGGNVDSFVIPVGHPVGTIYLVEDIVVLEPHKPLFVQ